MLFIGGVKLRWFVIALSVIVGAILYLVIFTDNFSYANDRILGWLDPFNEQIWQKPGRPEIPSMLSAQAACWGWGWKLQAEIPLPAGAPERLYFCHRLRGAGADRRFDYYHSVRFAGLARHQHLAEGQG